MIGDIIADLGGVEMSKPLDKCKSGREIIHHLEHCDQVIETRQSGSHFIAKTKEGMVVVPDHPGDLAPGTLRSIRKMLAKIGIMVILAGCLIGILGNL